MRTGSTIATIMNMVADNHVLENLVRAFRQEADDAWTIIRGLSERLQGAEAELRRYKALARTRVETSELRRIAAALHCWPGLYKLQAVAALRDAAVNIERLLAKDEQRATTIEALKRDVEYRSSRATAAHNLAAAARSTRILVLEQRVKDLTTLIETQGAAVKDAVHKLGGVTVNEILGAPLTSVFTNAEIVREPAVVPLGIKPGRHSVGYETKRVEATPYERSW